MKTKICTRCCFKKSLLDFRKHVGYKLNRLSICKNCERKYQIKNKDRIKVIHKQWYKRNKIKESLKCKQRYNKNKELYLLNNKKYYINNKEKIKMYPSNNPKNKRDRYLKRVYGITLEQYNLMLESQNGVCAICKNLETQKTRYGTPSLAVDHNHKTGKIRGLLCCRCNTILGLINENTNIFNAASTYLNNKS